MKSILFSILICAASFAARSHQFFISITDMSYDLENERIETTMKLTAHDFEHIIEHEFGQKVHLEKVADSSEIGQYVKSYLASHFQVWSGDEQLTLNYVGKEITVKDDLYFYFTFPIKTEPKELTVKNTLLFEEFDQQQNIVHYTYKDQTKSVTLIPSKPQETLVFDN